MNNNKAKVDQIACYNEHKTQHAESVKCFKPPSMFTETLKTKKGHHLFFIF